MKVEDILRRKGTTVITVGPGTTVKSAANRLRMENIASLVVMEQGSLVGIVSEREIVRALARHGELLLTMTVGEVMTRSVETCRPDDDLKRVMQLMTRHRMRHLPVMSEGALAGIVSIGDVVKHRLEDLELETSVLKDVYLATR